MRKNGGRMRSRKLINGQKFHFCLGGTNSPRAEPMSLEIQYRNACKR